jgi:hypothetical protein
MSAQECGVDGPMFVVSGRVSELVVQEGSVSLLQDMRNQSAFAAAMMSLTEATGSANAVSLALSDGEDVSNFGCLIGEQITVGGSFSHLEFKNDEEVKAVVSQFSKDVLYAHAVVRVSDGLLWMPFNITRGRTALIKSTYRMGRGGFLAAMGIFAVMAMFFGDLKFSYVWLFLMLACSAATMIGLAGWGVYRDSRHEGIYAEKIFKAMGFKNPEAVNLAPFSTTAQNGYLGGSHYVFHLRKALAAHDSLSKSPNPQQPDMPQKKKSLP